MINEPTPVTWVIRNLDDHPHALLAAELRGAGRRVDLVEWAGRSGRPIELRLGRRRADSEPSRIHVPSIRAARLLMTCRGSIITRELNSLTAAAGLLRSHRTRRVVCLVEADPAFGGASATARWKLPIRRLIAKRVDCFVANTAGGADWLRSTIGVSPDRIVEGWWMAGVAAPAKRRPRIAGAPLRVTSVGKLIERKGHDLLLEASALLRRDGTALQVRIAGTGPELESLRAIDTKAEFVGHLGRRELVELLADTDVLVLASREDLLGRAAVEALSMGVPVVASSATGVVTALVEASGCGLAFPAGDAAALADLLRTLLVDSSTLQTVTAAAERLAPTLAPASCVAPITAGLLRAEARP